MTAPRKPRRQQQRAIDTKRRIFDAAGLVFVAKGYDGASVNDIIDAADTSKGAFYRHYPDGKLSLAQAIMENTLTMNGLKPQRVKLQEVVDIGLILAYRIAREDTLLAALLLSFHKDAPDTYGTPWPDWITFNTGQVAEAQQRGEVKSFINPAEQAYQIAAAWSGVVLMANNVDGHLGGVEERVSRLYKNLMLAIANPEVLPEVDFAADRGCRLYAAFLEEQASKEFARE
ncbi:TetR/AcrR family transcriptional regulator [Streptomyces sp. NPDC048045]|uniref:TetR/AcrR family transcriptional regulator n=1 Tax=Streptomyces sp. NPDC048045 TaxID=3154710 RepID=UPI00341E38A5